MKKRMLSALLAVVLLICALPLTALADTNEGSEGDKGQSAPTKVTVNAVFTYYTSKTDRKSGSSKTLSSEKNITVNADTFGYYVNYDGKMYEFIGVQPEGGSKANSITLSPDPNTSEITYNVLCLYTPHTHNYRPGHNRIQHWEACACGSILSIGYHVDPATDADSICTCGYKFSSNANLVTLNLSNIVMECRVNDEKTEYLAKVHNYKPVTSSEVKYRTFDALATVEAPSVVDISEGMNVVEVTVTAEDRKTTKTYTVYALLTPKIDGLEINYASNFDDGFEVVIDATAKDRRGYVTLDLPESAADKIGLLLESTDAKNLVIQPKYNRWSNVETAVTIPSAILEQVGETDANILIKNYSGNIEIPNGDMEKLAEAGEAVRFALIKDGDDVTLAVTADEKEVENTKIAVTAATRK